MARGIQQRRFGATAVEKGYITFDQLLEAIHIQIVEDVEEDKHRLIGKILCDQGHMSVPQINDVLVSLGKGQN